MSSARVRTVACVPRLDLAIRAGPVYLFRGRTIDRPAILTERSPSDIAISKVAIESVNTSSFGWQTNDNNGFPTFDPNPDSGH